MSNTKHTPGKWTTEPHGNTTALYSGRDSQHHGLRLMNLDDGDSNFKANAALIARAPEMAERIEILESGLNKIIEMNRQQAEDQYGNADKAENWSCVRVAREALKIEKK